MLDRRLFLSTVDELTRTHGDRLLALRGQTLSATWVAWDAADDTWFPDEAVILEIGADRLEIVFQKFNEVALTWNCIDTSGRPAWVADWSEDLALIWRRDALPALRSAVGKTITGVTILTHLLRTTVVYDPKRPGRVGQQDQGWVLHGLELALGEERLLIFNALDENGITADPPAGPDIRRIPLK